jgi:Holliday junction resolvasome RuvABC endonuclease subunit
MVKYLLQITGTLQIDASDALAIALCHSHQQQAMLRNHSALLTHS